MLIKNKFKVPSVIAFMLIAEKILGYNYWKKDKNLHKEFLWHVIFLITFVTTYIPTKDGDYIYLIM